MAELLERGPCLEELTGHLRRTAAGEGRLVAIGGEAGVGKTALVELLPAVRGVRPRPPRLLRRPLDARSARPRPRHRARARPRRRPVRTRRKTGATGCFVRSWRPLPPRPGPTVIVGEDAPLGRRRLARAAPLPRPADRRAAGVLIVVTYRDDELGADTPAPADPGRPGDGAGRPSPRVAPAVGRRRADAGRGQRARPGDCTG